MRRTYDVLVTLWVDVIKNPQVWLVTSLLYVIWFCR